MSSRARLLLGSLVAALLLGTSVPAYAGDVPGPASSANAATAADVIGDWKGPRKAVKQTVTFHKNGTVSGNAGCNAFSGTYSVSSGSISVGPLAATLKLCDDATMYAEQMFLAKIQTAKSVASGCETLKLTGPDGTLRLTPYVPEGQPEAPPCVGGPVGVNSRP